RSAGFLFLTHADTDILLLDEIAGTMPNDFPPIRAFNIARLGGDTDLLDFLDRTAPEAEIVIVRLHGGRASFAAGLERLRALADGRHPLLSGASPLRQHRLRGCARPRDRTAGRERTPGLHRCLQGGAGRGWGYGIIPEAVRCYWLRRADYRDEFRDGHGQSRR